MVPLLQSCKMKSCCLAKEKQTSKNITYLKINCTQVQLQNRKCTLLQVHKINEIKKKLAQVFNINCTFHSSYISYIVCCFFFRKEKYHDADNNVSSQGNIYIYI